MHNCQPVVVTFEEVTDRDDILKLSKMKRYQSLQSLIFNNRSFAGILAFPFLKICQRRQERQGLS